MITITYEQLAIGLIFYVVALIMAIIGWELYRNAKLEYIGMERAFYTASKNNGFLEREISRMRPKRDAKGRFLPKDTKALTFSMTVRDTIKTMRKFEKAATEIDKLLNTESNDKTRKP